MNNREKNHVLWNAGNAVYAGMSLLHVVDFEGRDDVKDKLFECWEKLTEVAQHFGEENIRELEEVLSR